MEIKRQPVPTQAVFHRKCELASISCGSHNNFRGPLKTEDSFNFFYKSKASCPHLGLFKQADLLW
jgi:hypothetical protein